MAYIIEHLYAVFTHFTLIQSINTKVNWPSSIPIRWQCRIENSEACNFLLVGRETNRFTINTRDKGTHMIFQAYSYEIFAHWPFCFEWLLCRRRRTDWIAIQGLQQRLFHIAYLQFQNRQFCSNLVVSSIWNNSINSNSKFRLQILEWNWPKIQIPVMELVPQLQLQFNGIRGIPGDSNVCFKIS